MSRPANISVCCRVFSVNTSRPLTTYYKTNIITTAYQIFTPLHCTANICNCSRAGQVKKLTLNKQRMITFVVWCVVSMRPSVVCQLCEAATHCATSSVRHSPTSTGGPTPVHCTGDQNSQAFAIRFFAAEILTVFMKIPQLLHTAGGDTAQLIPLVPKICIFPESPVFFSCAISHSVCFF